MCVYIYIVVLCMGSVMKAFVVLVILPAQLGVQESRPGPENHRADPQGGKDRRAGGAEKSAAATSLQGQQETARSVSQSKSSLRLSGHSYSDSGSQQSYRQISCPWGLQRCYCARQQTGSPSVPPIGQLTHRFHHVWLKKVKEMTLCWLSLAGQ